MSRNPNRHAWLQGKKKYVGENDPGLGIGLELFIVLFLNLFVIIFCLIVLIKGYIGGCL